MGLIMKNTKIQIVRKIDGPHTVRRRACQSEKAAIRLAKRVGATHVIYSPADHLNDEAWFIVNPSESIGNCCQNAIATGLYVCSCGKDMRCAF